MKKFLIILFALLATVTQASRLPEMETRYRALEERFEKRDKNLPKDLKAYLQAFPYSTYSDEIRFMQGVMQVEKGHYKQSLRVLEQVEAKSLSRPHQTDYSFYRGYAYLMMQEYQRGAIYFNQLSKSDSRYTTRGTYYYAYCMYKLGRYDEALPALKRLEGVPEYRRTVPFYIVQIEYARGEYDEVEGLANELLKEQPDSPNSNELHRLLGEIYYNRQEYSLAAEYLRLYLQEAKEQGVERNRNNLYMLGASEYAMGEYENAVTHLKQVKQQTDSISEASCLTMGNAYVRLNLPEQAKLSYQAAASYGLTPGVTEEASYNYALCTYQYSSALGESVRAFNDFLRRFPDSKYETRIYRLLSDALMQSKNYAAALSTLDSIQDPSPKMLQTKQYLRYQLGADNFLQGKIPQSIDWMTAVINHCGESDLYTTEALYIRAEGEYRMRDYMGCSRDLQTFFSRPDASESDNFAMAHYLRGYCAFSQSKYSEARSAFTSFIDLSTATSPAYSDALNRIGDCYFNDRDFKQAIAYYNQVSQLQSTGADYALFQHGYALGLMHKNQEKIDVLSRLVSRYPSSDYADNGVYETARAQLQLEDERGAIATYDRLLASYPHSNLARKASLERSMLYRNLRMNDEAIASYRQTIETYPATEEAYSALDALQALYVETGNVNEYLDYTKQLARMNMSVSTREDSLLYASAEMQYIQASYPKAVSSLSEYLNRFCAGGRYCTTARYYLADSYYRLGQMREALGEYVILSEMSANPYQEEAVTRVAGICYDQGDYSSALEAFYRMNSLASTREQLHTAQVGILRCNSQLNNHRATIDISSQILSDASAGEELQAEARYARAKAYVAEAQWLKAMPDLESLSTEVRTSQGAESKFLLAQAYYEQQLPDEAEEQIMEFTRSNSQQQYWLARALILLSDINLRRGETFQARQYLLVLRQNYSATGDDIHSLIDSRLAALDESDKPVTKEEDNEKE